MAVLSDVVFIHGLFKPPFRKILGVEYFRGLKNALAGCEVRLHFPQLPASSSIEVRHIALCKYLDALNSENIYLVGHSMGGLDSRYYAAKRLDDCRIKYIVTIATPHRGSPIADRVVRGQSLFTCLLRRVFSDGVKALTTESCSVFNNQFPDNENIQYLSYAAARPANELPWWSGLLSRYISEGKHDALVPVSSAKWSGFQGVLVADHFETAGWNLAWPLRRKPAFDHGSFYRQLIEDMISSK